MECKSFLVFFLIFDYSRFEDIEVSYLDELVLLMSKRPLFRFDYRVYSKTGQKIPICTSGEEMENKSLIVKQKQIKQELDTVFQTYTLDELDYAEVQEFLGFLRELGQQYRSVHAELEVELADQYLVSYPDTEKFCKKIVDSTKLANARLKNSVERVNLKLRMIRLRQPRIG